ncbi:hypothetical protein, conserved [Plasmodium gonderi]|uniref:Uncharacterized protein n=1 Tax=Plasmodium gonderi TaxID=77519 RepID=A0A1Y1JG41_PLAGO|nr:hypothetical protein, conserved [Plasmodium gonderi]GAW81476.1 hypothetical protein, conserved [Plasmodium gonderi]
MEGVSKSNNVYALVKIMNMLDINAVSHVKTAIKLIIFDHFGLTMLLRADFKIFKVMQSSTFFILRTDVRHLSLFLYCMQPSQTNKHEFSLKVLKISNFMPNLACPTRVIENCVNET